MSFHDRDLDKELASAYDAQEKRKEALAESVDELRQVADSGQKQASGLKMLVGGIVGAVALAGSGILLADPSARPWFFVLAVTLVAMGAWSFARKQS